MTVRGNGCRIDDDFPGRALALITGDGDFRLQWRDGIDLISGIQREIHLRVIGKHEAGDFSLRSVVELPDRGTDCGGGALRIVSRSRWRRWCVWTASGRRGCGTSSARCGRWAIGRRWGRRISCRRRRRWWRFLQGSLWRTGGGGPTTGVGKPKRDECECDKQEFRFHRLVPLFFLAGGISKCMRLANAMERLETACKSNELGQVRRNKKWPL